MPRPAIEQCAIPPKAVFVRIAGDRRALVSIFELNEITMRREFQSPKVQLDRATADVVISVIFRMDT